MSRLNITVFLFLFTVLSCSFNKAYLTPGDVYKACDFDWINNSQNKQALASRLKTRNDSLLYNALLMKSQRKSETLKVIDSIDRFAFLGVSMGFEDAQHPYIVVYLDSFQYTRFTSMELFYLGIYFYSKRGADEVLDRFLREAVRRDTTNIYVLFELSKGAARSLRYTTAQFLLEHIPKGSISCTEEITNYVAYSLEKKHSTDSNLHFKTLADALKDVVIEGPLDNSPSVSF